MYPMSAFAGYIVCRPSRPASHALRPFMMPDDWADPRGCAAKDDEHSGDPDVVWCLVRKTTFRRLSLTIASSRFLILREHRPDGSLCLGRRLEREAVGLRAWFKDCSLRGLPSQWYENDWRRSKHSPWMRDCGS